MLYLPKKAPYLNPNERKVNQQIKSYVCANRFYEHIKTRKLQYRYIWRSGLERGLMTVIYAMTLDLAFVLCKNILHHPEKARDLIA
jgi:hypothetical protein